MANTKESAGGFNANNTVIGESILISGKLTGDEDLTIRGRVEGELSLSHTLIVEPSGIVKANVAVKNAIVSGVVVGNIAATESVELTREGRMVGDIRAPRVILVDGASFRGRIDMGEVEPGRHLESRPARPVTTRPATVRPAAAPARPTVVAKAGGAAKPQPPPPPKTEGKPPPPPPPAPVLVGEGGKKKVLVKKKK